VIPRVLPTSPSEVLSNNSRSSFGQWTEQRPSIRLSMPREKFAGSTRWPVAGKRKHKSREASLTERIPTQLVFPLFQAESTAVEIDPLVSMILRPIVLTGRAPFVQQNLQYLKSPMGKDWNSRDGFLAATA